MNEVQPTGSIDPGSTLECVELLTEPAPRVSIIWLHGLGADGFDFVPVVRELQALGAPAARYVFPHFQGSAVSTTRSRDWAAENRPEFIGEVGAAIMNAIGKHNQEQEARKAVAD